MPNPLTENLGQAAYLADVQKRATQKTSQDRLLDFLYKEESSSGTNPKAQVESDLEIKGNYQLSRTLFGEIQQAFPEFANITFEQATSPEGGLDRQVADAGTRVKSEQIAGIGVAPTPSLVATTWLTGAAGLKPAIAKAMIESRRGRSADVATHIKDPVSARRMNRATAELRNPQGGQ